METVEKQCYEAPVVKALELHQDSVLCASVNPTFGDSFEWDD